MAAIINDNSMRNISDPKIDPAATTSSDVASPLINNTGTALAGSNVVQPVPSAAPSPAPAPVTSPAPASVTYGPYIGGIAVGSDGSTKKDPTTNVSVASAPDQASAPAPSNFINAAPIPQGNQGQRAGYYVGADGQYHQGAQSSLSPGNVWGSDGQQYSYRAGAVDAKGVPLNADSNYTSAAGASGVGGSDLSKIQAQLVADKATASTITPAYLTGMAQKLGLSLYQIGDALGMSNAQVDAWMKGGAAPTPAPTPAPAPGQPLINTPNAATYSATQLGTPTQWNVTPDQTIQGRLASLMDPNSSLYQQWQTQGKIQGAERGMLNSSITSSAIQDSIMKGALPIAQGDAATFAKAAGYNADTANQFATTNAASSNAAGAFNAGQKNTLTGQVLSSNTQLTATDKNNATTLATANLNADTQKFVATLGSATQTTIANLNNSNQALMQSAHDKNTAILQNSTGAQQAYRDYANALLNIQMSDKMDATAKTTAIQNLNDAFNSAAQAFSSAGANVPDMTQVLSTFDTAASAATGGGWKVTP